MSAGNKAYQSLARILTVASAVTVICAVSSTPTAGEPATAVSPFIPDSRALALTKLTFQNDFLGYLNGWNVKFTWASFFPIDERVTVDQVYGRYSADMGAADRHFDNKIIAITGNLVRVGRNDSAGVFALLAGKDGVGHVEGFLTSDMAARAASLTGGQSLQLICIGDRTFTETAVLRACETPISVVTRKAASVGRLVDSVFDGSGHSLPPLIKYEAGMLYVVGTTLPATDACEQATADNMASCQALLTKDRIEKARPLYDELARRLSLPSRAEVAGFIHPKSPPSDSLH